MCFNFRRNGRIPLGDWSKGLGLWIRYVSRLSPMGLSKSVSQALLLVLVISIVSTGDAYADSSAGEKRNKRIERLAQDGIGTTGLRRNPSLSAELNQFDPKARLKLAVQTLGNSHSVVQQLRQLEERLLRTKNTLALYHAPNGGRNMGGAPQGSRFSNFEVKGQLHRLEVRISHLENKIIEEAAERNPHLFEDLTATPLAKGTFMDSLVSRRHVLEWHRDQANKGLLRPQRIAGAASFWVAAIMALNPAQDIVAAELTNYPLPVEQGNK